MSKTHEVMPNPAAPTLKNRTKRWLIAGALALSPLVSAGSMASVPAMPFVNGIPWCCAVRGDINQKPMLPAVPTRATTFRLTNRRFRPGRLTGAARRKTPRAGCFHCGSATPEPIGDAELRFKTRIGDMTHTFCSQPCVAACQDYHAAGLGAVYAFGPPARLDAAVTSAPHTVQTEGDTSVAHLLVEGLHCGACIWIIERALSRLPGVTEARVQLTTGRARVAWKTGETTLEAVLTAIARAGYPARPYDPGVAEEPMRAAHQLWLGRLAVSGFGALATMFIAEPLYYDYANVAQADQAMWHMLRYLGMVIGTATAGYTAIPFLRGAWAGLQRRSLGMDVLIALGVIATYAASVWGFLTKGPVYFDSLAMFLFLIVVGRFAESAAKGKVYAAMEHLLGASAKTARVVRDGVVAQVPASELVVGDMVELLPGDQVPADGVITRGRTSLDEAMLTGESRPVAKGPGEALIGGTLNLEGAVAMTVSRVGEDTTFARLSQLVHEADGARTQVQRLADAAGHWGTIAVALTAMLTAIGWAIVDPSRALPAAVAVLIITCPCALGLATPTALVLAVSRALKQGLLFKRSEALEDLLAVKTVIFDKTGTLTTGEPEVVGVLGLEPETLALAAVLEAGSEHPLGKAVVKYARFRGVQATSTPDDFSAVPGLGVEATVGGKRALAGRGSWLEAEGFELPEAWRVTAEAWMADGRTVLWVGQGERVLGAIALGDRLRPDALETVRLLQASGLGVTLLTGDNRGAAESVARQLGITDVIAEVLPEGKLAAIRALQAERGAVAMVGDGLNDAPALAAANVGIAMARGADLSVVASDVVIVGGRLGAVAEAFALSRRTFTVIRQNFKISAAYNLLAIPLAVFGFVTPLVAAILMPLSSLAVLVSALRLRR
jgi:Cu2+-exporting ATPase